MTESRDWQAFCDIIRASDEVTAGKTRNVLALGMMFRVLERYSLEDIVKAVDEHIRTNKFAVTPADIIRHLDGSPDDKSTAAWRTFLRTMERYGYYDSVRFPDPAFHYVVEQLGGWERIGHEWHQLTEREIEFRRKEWVHLYEIGLRVASWGGETGKVSVPKYLCGFYERDNREGGHLDFIPDVVDVATGNRIDRHALESQAPDNIIALPVFGTEASL